MKRQVDVNTKMKEMAKSSDVNFKVTLTEVFQQAIRNMLETNENRASTNTRSQLKKQQL